MIYIIVCVMKFKQPKISVIIPTYNQAKYIVNTLNSVLEQEYENLELIVIDGLSTDGTIEILESFSEKIDFG